MSDIAKARSGTWITKRAWATSKDSLGLNLGELRAVIAKADGMPDNAEVKFGGVSKSMLEGEYYARRIDIKSEKRQP